jgi:ribonuclease HII
MVQRPTSVEEDRIREQGYKLIAGIDEAGRGPLAGPVVAGAVVLPLGKRPAWLDQVRDSKMLAPRERERLFDCIQQDSASVGVGIVWHDDIDRIGIAPATRLAMRRAVEDMAVKPEYLLIDFVRLPSVPLPQRSIVNGDALCFSIAAASIIAKVSRDRIMLDLDRQYPGYGMARHKGYATSEHLEFLRRLGPCPVHRRTFSPVQAVSSAPAREWRDVLGQG